jgi:hypothetical protein
MGVAAKRLGGSSEVRPPPPPPLGPALRNCSEVGRRKGEKRAGKMEGRVRRQCGGQGAESSGGPVAIAAAAGS